jgi:hypothetical protein
VATLCATSLVPGLLRPGFWSVRRWIPFFLSMSTTR